MTERLAQGLLDTSVIIDIDAISEDDLPGRTAISTVTLAELSQGPHLANDARSRAERVERLQRVEATYPRPLPFDAACARKYGSLVALVRAAGRHSRSRRIDLMIAATAACHDIPLYTRNPDDFIGIDSAVLVVAV
jgi:predicted nucleic acid-binding protein